ncbi:MAG: choice-of-anchor D domain-containing protein, partial [Dokdonia sp.]|nr:choice-of-anchor D domain-containing protein [Dokdonia sp.]
MQKITFSNTVKTVFSVFVFFASFSPQAFAQYCTSNGNGGDGFNTGTRRVIFNTIDNPTPIEDNAYSNFTAISTTVTAGSVYNLTVRVNTDGNYTTGTRAWFDWNQDNDFLDPGEQFTLGAATNVTNGTTSASPYAITIPLTAAVGTTRMRISTRYNVYPSSCAIGFDGEVEDYSIIINAGAPSPEIDVTGLGNSISNNDTFPSTIDDTDFGTVSTTGSQIHTFTIVNNGSADLDISSVALSGPGSTEFAMSSSAPTTLSNGGSTTFDITYAPSTVGSHTATVTILNTDSDENPYTFSITGMGAAPAYCPAAGNGNAFNDVIRRVRLNTIDNNTPLENVAYSDFTAISTNLQQGSSHNLSVQVSTDGNVTYFVKAFIDWNQDFDFDDAGEELNLGTATNVANGATTLSPLNITIPLTAALGTTRMRIIHKYNAAIVGSCDNVAFGGEVEDYSLNITSSIPAPEAFVSGNGNEIMNNDMAPSTADHTDFGGASIATPIVRTFTIANPGNLNLIIGTPAITGSANFSLTTAPTLTIVPSGSTTFSITYIPTVLGTDAATVTFTTNDSDENPYNFAIEGEGIDPVSTVAVYCEAFDAAGHNWNSTTGTNGSWSVGSETTASAGATGDYVYTQRSSGRYSNNSHQVYTSPIIDLSGYEKLNFSIDLWYDMSNDSNTTTPTPDGFQIQFSDDGGTTWRALGGNGEGTNWYNTAVIYNFGSVVAGNPVYINGWTGNTSGWSTASIDLHAQGFDNNANVQFRVDFRSDNSTNDVGVAFDNVCISGTATATIVDPSCGPAGIGTNLSLWLRADAGTSVPNGSLVSTWEDQAFTTNYTNAEAGFGTEPTYYNNATNNVNFNPVIHFDGSSSTMNGRKGFYSDEFYIVVKPSNPITSASAPNDIFCGDDYRQVQPSEDVTGFEMGDTSARFSNDVVAFNQGPQTNYGIANVSTTQTFSEANLFNGRTNSSNNGAELFCDGLNIGNAEVNVSSFTRIENSRYWLGRSERFGASYDGDIMEVISYRGRNSDVDKQKIQSYLAIKYGIGLGTNGIGLDYVDSDGNVIWDASADSGDFNYDVAGIGRDDCSSLHQRQSKSINSTSLLTMGLTDIYATNDVNPNNFANDKNYLMWAHDGGNLGASAPIVVDMSFGISGLNSVVDFIAVQRSWKVQESGTVGTTKITIPEVALSATITPPGKFLMFISDTPTFNPTSEYSIMEVNGANLETHYDFDGTKYITFGYAPEYVYNRAVTFDGVHDYLDVGDELNAPGNFTMSAWVKNIGGGTLLSKRNAAFSEGYEVRINGDGSISMEWINGSSVLLTSTTSLPSNEWHHVAVTCNGINTTTTGMATIYIDGVSDTSAVVPVIPVNNQSFLMGAADGTNPTSFFSGTLDEVRIWNERLTEDQLHFIMNQEIEQHTDATVRGKIIPQYISKNEVGSIPWTDLAGYFPMNRYTFTNIKDESGNDLVASIKNLDTVDEQTAPLPYISASDGDWTADNTWEDGSGFDKPDAVSIVDASRRIDWNIVQTSHNVTTQNNNVVLGLEVLNNELSIENDSKIEVSHYLRLNGVIDLVNESQLIQTIDSDLEPTSTGNLERDQAGTADTYTYNYWSSPVSTINPAAINQDFSIASLMRDGSDVNNPIPFGVTGGFDGAPGTPIQLSAYWFYKYDNQPSSTYAAWQYVGPYGIMSPGEGWTMKGPGTGPITADQNYTFIGKPNNSTTAVNIGLPVTGGNDYLVGNPFPSALDANDFINDN